MHVKLYWGKPCTWTRKRYSDAPKANRTQIYHKLLLSTEFMRLACLVDLILTCWSGAINYAKVLYVSNLSVTWQFIGDDNFTGICQRMLRLNVAPTKMLKLACKCCFPSDVLYMWKKINLDLIYFLYSFFLHFVN